MEPQGNGQANGRAAEEEGASPAAPDEVVEEVGAVIAPPAPPRDERALYGDAFATAGEWLSARRRALQLTLEEVELATRVREDYLAAIEDMDPRRMPSGPYAPGFVRTYALFLELDPDAVTARFREEMSPRRLRTPRVEPVRKPLRLQAPPRVWGALLGAGAAGLVLMLGWRQITAEREPLVPAVPEGLADWVAAEVQSRRTSTAPELVVGPDLALRARVPTWLEARAPNGETLIARTLEAGETWTADRIPGILVSTDNGGAIEVLLDGRAVERLGAAGLPVTDWPADPARGWTAPPEPVAPTVEFVAVDAEEPEPAVLGPPLEEVDGVAPFFEVGEAVAEDAEALLEEMAEEETLVSPDLPSGDEIAVEALPPLTVGDAAYVPDPDETAAAEGREAPDED